MKLLKIVRILLIPISLLYGLLIEFRNFLYNHSLYKSQLFSIPIISVGNLTLGGTGKTPFTIMLAEVLRSRFPGIAIVSRGYGRKSKGLQVVSDGQKILLTAELAGDEPYLLAKRLNRAVIVVCEKRVEAINFLQKNFNLDLIILDDAYQHRQVHRDVNILLINRAEAWHYNRPLPSGTLREYRHNYKRAQVIVLTNEQAADRLLIPQFKSIPVFTCHSKLEQIIDQDFNAGGDVSELKGKEVYAFAGIAHPANFRQEILNLGLKIRVFKVFKDHYHYHDLDLQSISDHCRELECSMIICTEKDLVKIVQLRKSLDLLHQRGQKIYGLRMRLIFNDWTGFIRNVQGILDNKVTTL